MEIVQQKTCLGCKTSKNLTEFSSQRRGKFGKKSKCRACTSLAYSAWMAQAVGGFCTKKTCRACRKTKLASSFTSRPVSKDGLQSYCRECSTVKIKLRRKLFYEEINEIKRVPCFDCKIQYPPSVSVVIGSCVSEETA